MQPINLPFNVSWIFGITCFRNVCIKSNKFGIVYCTGFVAARQSVLDMKNFVNILNL